VRPLLVRTVPSLFGSESNEGCKGCCKDCSLTLGCSMIGSSVGISGIKSKSSLVFDGETTNWRRFRLRVPWAVSTV